jgi:hypothetical protein
MRIGLSWLGIRSSGEFSEHNYEFLKILVFSASRAFI